MDDEIKITKLPPGKAYGCDDLRNWGGKRRSKANYSKNIKNRKKQEKRAKELSELSGRKVKPFK